VSGVSPDTQTEGLIFS